MEIDQNPARQAAIERAVSIMEWEGGPLPGVFNPTINPDLAETEVGSDPTTHPLRRSRIREE